MCLVEEVLEAYGLDEEVPVYHSEDLDEDEPGPDSLVIHPGRASLDLRRRVSESGARLWDEDEIVREVGRAALVHLGADFDLVFGNEGETVLSSPVNVDSEGALDTARPHVKDAAVALLEMVPHVLYEYSVSCVVGDGELGEEFDESGSVALNMVSGEISDLKFDEVVDMPLSEAGEMIQPSVDTGDADEETRKLLADRLSRKVSMEVEKRQTQIYETRRVKPPANSIELDGGQLVYRGIWTVKGGRKDVVIDSATGEVLSPTTSSGVEIVYV